MARDPEDPKEIDLSDETLRSLGYEQQRHAALAWFYFNFEGPEQRLPRLDGNWLYLHGGPYDAMQELQNRFEGKLVPGAIEEISEELNRQNSDWAPTRHRDDELDNEVPELQLELGSSEDEDKAEIDPDDEDDDEADSAPLGTSSDVIKRYHMLLRVSAQARLMQGGTEQEIRDQISRQLDRAEEAILEIRQVLRPNITKPGIGHNNPPPDTVEEQTIVTVEDCNLAQALVADAKIEVKSSSPDRQKLVNAWKSLKIFASKVGLWAASSTQVASDKFAEEIGTQLARALGFKLKAMSIGGILIVAHHYLAGGNLAILTFINRFLP